MTPVTVSIGLDRTGMYGCYLSVVEVCYSIHEESLYITKGKVSNFI